VDGAFAVGSVALVLAFALALLNDLQLVATGVPQMENRDRSRFDLEALRGPAITKID